MKDLAADLVRDPSRRTSSQSCTGEFISLTTGKRLAFESAGERDLLILLDVDYRTVELTCQPERFYLTLPDRTTTYVPDVYAESIRGERTYFQVKPASRLAADPTLKGRIEAIENACSSRGAEHRLCPREPLVVGARLKNSRWVHAASSAISGPQTVIVGSLLARMKSPTTVGALKCEGLTDGQFDCLLGLVGHREVYLPLNLDFNDETKVMW